MKRSTLKTVFFIYSEAHVAVFMAALAILELVCGIALHLFASPFSVVAFGASVGFFAIALGLAFSVYRSAKAHSII